VPNSTVYLLVLVFSLLVFDRLGQTSSLENKKFGYLVPESSDCLWGVHDDCAVLRDVTPCSLVEIWRRFRNTCLHEGRRVGGAVD